MPETIQNEPVVEIIQIDRNEYQVRLDALLDSYKGKDDTESYIKFSEEYEELCKLAGLHHSPMQSDLLFYQSEWDSDWS